MARWILAVLFALSSLPIAAFGAPALTVPPNGITGCTVASAGGGIDQDYVVPTVMAPSPDLRDVELGATASAGASFPGLYIGSFAYSCTLLGSGTLEYGSASGALMLEASSTPDSLPPDVANQGNDPFSNSGRAEGEGLLQLQFDDSGTVVSDVLPPGTPVQLEFSFVLESLGVALGPPLGSLLGTSATYSVRAVDTAAPGAPVEVILLGTDQVTRTLDTQVGRTIELRGILSLSVHALAGREIPGATYYPEASASIDASNSSHFTIQTPEDVSFLAESGHDYAALPAPGEALLLATGALVLAAGRLRTGRC